MKKRFYCVAIFVLLLCLGVLGGCVGTFDATELLQGNLDLIYRNQYTDQYLNLVNSSAAEADRQYAEGIGVERDFFAYYYDIDLDLCPEDISEQIEELYRQIYDKSKYEVGSATVKDGVHLVQLTIYPIDIIQKVQDEDADAFLDQWDARGALGEFDTMSDEEFETAWAQGVIDLVAARLDSLGYLEPETISVQIQKNDEGYYAVKENDWQRVDELMIAY